MVDLVVVVFHLMKKKLMVDELVVFQVSLKKLIMDLLTMILLVLHTEQIGRLNIGQEQFSLVKNQTIDRPDGHGKTCRHLHQI